MILLGPSIPVIRWDTEIYIYKGIQNSAISSTAANRIVARLYT